MIVDLERFAQAERPCWQELEQVVARLDAHPGASLSLEQALRLHYLYERAAAALGRIETFSGDPQLRAYLESLVGRAYATIHSLGRPRRPWAVRRWFFGTFPRTFRRHIRAFGLSLAVTVAGAVFGALTVSTDPQTKEVTIPAMFAHAYQRPSERVAAEEARAEGAMGADEMTVFSTGLMTNNITVSLRVLALGATWGIGAVLMLFYNGLILGVVCADYILDGQGVFLAGWLLPHGTVEIPAILLAGQAAFVLARAMIGHGDRQGLQARLRQALPSLTTLAGGLAILLVWAGIVEAFLSQLHRPVLPYAAKIAFGLAQLALLAAFLGLSGRGEVAEGRP